MGMSKKHKEAIARGIRRAHRRKREAKQRAHRRKREAKQRVQHEEIVEEEPKVSKEFARGYLKGFQTAIEIKEIIEE